MRLVHLSDLHIGCPGYVSHWGDRVLSAIETMKPDLVVITGDLTDNGYDAEYERAAEFIQKIQAPTFVVPGNHDARNAGYIVFEEIFRGRFFKYRDSFVSLLGVDSTEPDIDDGHIGRENYGMIKDFFAASENQWKIFALHHHLIPIPNTGRERHIPVDSGDVLALLVEAGVHLVLSGHKHRPWMWYLQGTIFLTAGTATTTRLKGRSYPSFNLLDLNGEKIDIFSFNVKEGNSVKVWELIKN